MKGYIHWHRLTVIVLCGLAAIGIIAACKDSKPASASVRSSSPLFPRVTR